MIERMQCRFTEIKLAVDDTAEMTFGGYGAVFGNVDSYGDVIAPGAFAKSLAEMHKSGQWPAMLLQHGGWGVNADDLNPIGIWTEMAEDGVGLKVTGKLADTPRGREMYALMKMEPRPAINGLSIGYIPKKWTQRSKPEDPRRTLEEVELLEVSPVTFPANGKARVASVKAAGLTERELERLLTQDAGMSRSEARALMRHGAAGLKAMQDAGGESTEELAELVALAKTITIA